MWVRVETDVPSAFEISSTEVWVDEEGAKIHLCWVFSPPILFGSSSARYPFPEASRLRIKYYNHVTSRNCSSSSHRLLAVFLVYFFIQWFNVEYRCARAPTTRILCTTLEHFGSNVSSLLPLFRQIAVRDGSPRNSNIEKRRKLSGIRSKRISTTKYLI